MFTIHCVGRVHSRYTTRISQTSFSIGQGLSGCESGPSGMEADGSGMWRVGEMFGALTLWVMSIKSWSVQCQCKILPIRVIWPRKVDWNYVIDRLGQQIHNTIFKCSHIAALLGFNRPGVKVLKHESKVVAAQNGLIEGSAIRRVFVVGLF